MKQKICILAYDGLDINLVEKFDLENLKQREYGKTDISDFDRIFTPVLWGSFLTGKNLESKYEKIENQRKEIILKKIIRNIFLWLKQDISAYLATQIRETGRLIGIIDLVAKEIGKNSSVLDGENVFFDFVDSYEAINVPTFSQERWKAKHSLKEAIKSGIGYEGEVWKCFQKTRRELISDLNEKEITMSWFLLADRIGHIYRSNKSKLFKAYSALDQLTEEVKKSFDGWVLVISDHGMKKLGRYGDHTNLNYGFYSSNTELGLNKPKITDFYDIIKSKVREK